MSDRKTKTDPTNLVATKKKPHPEAHLEDEEKVIDGRPDVDFPALLVKDVPGG
jgi:hypothetical protein